MKNYKSIFSLALISLSSTAATAHDGSEQTSVINGIIHFMTEPDHLLVSVVIAVCLIAGIRKMKDKRS